MTLQERIDKVSQMWFLMEPLLFAVYCSHQLVPNDKLKCTIRTGKGSIEYNPEVIRHFNDHDLELLLRSEIVRILLKHPYDRQPEDCISEAIISASDCVLTCNYTDLTSIGLTTVDEYGLKPDESFEWYAHKISAMMANDSRSQNDDSSEESDGDSLSNGFNKGESEISEQKEGDGENGNRNEGKPYLSLRNEGKENGNLGNDPSRAQQSELWEEDQMRQECINEIITSTHSWGSIGDQLREKIIASTKPQIDYRRAFAGFRASVLSSKRHLTRMRPNRRMDFEQMGSVYELTTRLLVAIDVSMSVDSEMLSHFYGLINRFFKYGIEHIDVVQFDVVLGTVRNIKKACTDIEICGRGGTSFQPVIDLAANEKYDGVAIFTDGFAPSPSVPTGFHTPILWVADSEDSYNRHHDWMELLPHSRTCWLKI